jgi:endonuclease/exonuclease/phosphatase family metal-dependent hydrolase
MRIASFNVESLFDRARAFKEGDSEAGKAALEQHAQINGLLGEPVYTDTVKAEIVDLLTQLGLDRSDDGGDYAILRQNRGHLVLRHQGGGVEIVAGGRADWIGWVELKMEPVNEVATANTARVLHDVAADIQAVVEADNRIALRDFSKVMLTQIGGQPFDEVMLIDGNDDRGIDVGLMTRGAYAITEIRSHISDTDDHGVIFSRDCLEITVATPTDPIVLLVNHFKSKGFGSQAGNDAKRLRQATRVAEIYDGLRAEGQDRVVVLGDLNDTPDSAPLQPLIGTDLEDITASPAFTADDHPGTFGNGTKRDKIDYILLSPALFARATGGTIFRTGVWGGIHGTMWPHYPSMTMDVEQASDHAAIYADLDVI